MAANRGGLVAQVRNREHRGGADGAVQAAPPDDGTSAFVRLQGELSRLGIVPTGVPSDPTLSSCSHDSPDEQSKREREREREREHNIEEKGIETGGRLVFTATYEPSLNVRTHPTTSADRVSRELGCSEH